MDSHPSPRELPEASSLPMRISGSRVSRNEAWTRHKDEIQSFYILDDNTLSSTMDFFEQKYGLKACRRTWKAKLKEWKFEKYLTRGEQMAIVAIAEKRQREERKETAFYHFGRKIDTERLENFKKRKLRKAAVVASPISRIPEGISYSTPSPERHHSSTEVPSEDTSWVVPEHHEDIEATSPGPEQRAEADQTSKLDAQSTTTYAANLQDVPFDEATSKRSIAEWRARSRYEASQDQRSIVEQNLEFLETALASSLVRIKINGLIPEGVATTPDALEWSVSRSPMNCWCDYCLRIIGSGMRYACQMCPDRDGTLYYCLACYKNNNERCCLNHDHQLTEDESLLGWECKRAADNARHVLCESEDCRRDLIYCNGNNCRRRIEGIYFHCCSCGDDDFDICLQCVAKGSGCGNLEHILELAVGPINPLAAKNKPPQRTAGLADAPDQSFPYRASDSVLFRQRD